MLESNKEPAKENKKINQEQFYELVTGNELSWQAIIYDLINTEQLDPWDVDLSLLSNRYLEKVRDLEEANFFVSSKVLLACSFLLRIKTEILLNHEIKSIDEILFGKKEEKKTEKFEFDEEVPLLAPKTPLPRHRKVSLQELMEALNKAMETESRRIKRRIRSEMGVEVSVPKRTLNIKDRIRKIYARISTMFKSKQSKINYLDIAGRTRDEKIASFLPVLHLDYQKKITLEQKKHLDHIWIWLYEHYQKTIMGSSENETD